MSLPLPFGRAPVDLNRLLIEEVRPRISVRHLTILLATWSICTLLLLVFRPGYTFPKFGLLDSWIYTSYQWDLRNQIADFGPTYYGSRLSWILPGALIHSFLPPVAANLCYKLLVSALFAIASGAIVYRARGLPAAIFAIGLSVISPQIIIALHSDYNNTPVLVYGALTLACITIAKTSRRWPWWILLAGVCLAGMAISNLSSSGLLGLGIAVFHLLWLRWGFKRQLVCVGLYLMAAAAVLLVLGGLSVRAGGQFYFLKPQIDMMLFIQGMKDNPWKSKNWLWLRGATWLILPAGALLLGLYRSFLAHSPDARALALTRALTAGLAASLTVAVIIESRVVGVLAYDYYGSYHLLFALPLLVMCCTPDNLSGNASTLRFGVSLISLLAFVLAGDGLTDSKVLAGLFPSLDSDETIPVMLAGIMFAAAALLALWNRYATHPPSFRFLGAEVLLAGLMVCTIPGDFHDHPISDRLPERYASVHAAYRTLARQFPAGSYRFWIHPYQKDGTSLASTKLWAYRLFTLKPFPTFDESHTTNDTIVVPCLLDHGPQALVTAKRVLAKARIQLKDEQIIRIPGDAGIGFDLVCFSMHEQTLNPEIPADEVPPEGILMDLRYDAAGPYPGSLQANIYGLKQGAFIDTAAGFPVFTRTNPRDHLATPFVSFSKGKAGVTRRLVVEAIMPADSLTSCIVQAEGYQELAHFALSRKGRSIRTISVPADLSSIRIYLQSDTDTPTALPTRITVYEIHQP